MTSAQNEYRRQRRWSRRAAFSQVAEASGSSSRQMAVIPVAGILVPVILVPTMVGIGSPVAAMNRKSAAAAAAKVG